MESVAIQWVLLLLVFCWAFLGFVLNSQQRYIAVMAWILASFWGVVLVACGWEYGQVLIARVVAL